MRSYSDDIELTIKHQSTDEKEDDTQPEPEKPSTCSQITNFIREGVFSFYRDATPFSTRTQEILGRTIQTSISLYSAWNAYWESNQRLENDVDANQTATSFLIILNTLIAILTFLCAQKMGGKGIQFLGNHAKQINAHEKWLIGLTNEVTNLAELVGKEPKDEKEVQEIRTKAMDITQRIKSGEYIKKVGFFGSFSSIFASTQSQSENPPSTKFSRKPSSTQT